MHKSRYNKIKKILIIFLAFFAFFGIFSNLTFAETPTNKIFLENLLGLKIEVNKDNFDSKSGEHFGKHVKTVDKLWSVVLFVL